MDQLMVRLREKAAAEVRYADGVRRIYRERLRGDEKDLAVAQLSGTVRAIPWLIEDRAAMLDEVRRVGRTLRDARERLCRLDVALRHNDPQRHARCAIGRDAAAHRMTTRRPRGPRLASIRMSPPTDAPSVLPGACCGTGRCHRV